MHAQYIFYVIVLILVKQCIKALSSLPSCSFCGTMALPEKGFLLGFNVHCIFGAPPSRQRPIYRRRHIFIAWLRYMYYVYLCILTRTHVKHLQELFALNNKMNI